MLLPAVLTAAPLSLDNLIRPLDVEQVKISPTGEYLAIRKVHEGERILVFMSISPLKVTGVLRFRGSDEVGDFYWANDKRVVANVISRQAALEAPVSYGSLYAIDFDGSNGKNIFGWATGSRAESTRIKQVDPTYAHATLVDPLPRDKNEVLISTYPWARNWETLGEVYQLNIYSGVKKKVAGMPQVGGRAFTDNIGELLFANGTDRNDEPQLYVKIDSGWGRVADPELDRATPVGFDPSTNEAFLLLDQEHQTERMVKLSLTTGKWVSVYQHKFADMTGIIRHPVTNTPVGVYLDPDYPEEDFFNEGDGFAALFRGLKKAFKGYNIEFTSYTKDGSRGILKVSGDRLPGDYYIVGIKSKTVAFLLSSAQWLDPNGLNPMRADSFTTEDGYRIGVYLTFPHNQTENLPLVVMPHGGPHSRDYWGYNRDAQILSQNGYLVLQVNFRGSTGYGDEFFDSGKMQWGGKIQNDIADAVKWTVGQGYADAERVCIYGASFGGYSAMMGPIRNPNLYKCAIGYAGVYDLSLLFTEGDVQRRERGIAYLKTTVGTDKAFIMQNSPLYSAERINIPVFIVHGEKDERAPIEHAKLLLEKLESKHKNVESLIVPNEGHGFYSEKNNKLFYTEMLKFIDLYIGPDSVVKGDI